MKWKRLGRASKVMFDEPDILTKNNKNFVYKDMEDTYFMCRVEGNIQTVCLARLSMGSECNQPFL